MGCQSSLTTSKLLSNWIDSPIIRFFPTIRLYRATHIDWGNGYPVNGEKGFAALACRRAFWHGGR